MNENKRRKNKQNKKTGIILKLKIKRRIKNEEIIYRSILFI